MATQDVIRAASEDLEGGHYSVEYHPDTSIIAIYEIPPASDLRSAPLLAAQGTWTNDRIEWAQNRLGSAKAATVASVLATHLVVPNESVGARSGWEQPCPACAREGLVPALEVRTTFGEMLRGVTVQCGNGHDLHLGDPDGRIARNIFLINDALRGPTTTASSAGRAATPNPGPFRVTKMFDRGTDSPIVRRIVLQFFAIIESGALTFDAATANAVKSLLFETMRDVGHVEEAVQAYVRREEEALAALCGGGVHITPNAIQYDDPGVALRKLFGDALMSAVIALRNVPRLATAIVGAALDGGKSWKKLRRLLDEATARHDPGATWVGEFYSWSEQLVGLRGQFEHPHPPLEITPVRVEVRDGQLHGVHAPRLVQPATPLRDYLEELMPRMVDEMERFIWLFLAEKCAAGYRLERFDDGASSFRYAPVRVTPG
jgi:hypothetical protein